MIMDIKNTQNIINIHNENKTQFDLNIEKIGFGFIIFIIIFVILIPIILFKNQMYRTLEVYMPNIDIIATVVSWHGGPFKIWTHLYPPSPLTIYGFYSQTIINYIALLGLTYIITRETKRSNSIARGWSMGFIMLLITYLLPGQIISIIMDIFNKLLSSNFNINSKLPVMVIGSLIGIGIIAFEVVILHFFKKNLEQFAKNIINLQKYF